jgi:hypothetical protein
MLINLEMKIISMSQIIEIIEKVLLRLPYVTAEPNRFGVIEFHLNRREIGHIHSEGLADISSHMTSQDEIVKMIQDETRQIGDSFFQ